MSKKLYGIISRIFNIPISEINDESSPETIEKWDSLNTYILLEDIESEFNIKFDIEEIFDIKTTGDFKRHLQNHGVKLDES